MSLTAEPEQPARGSRRSGLLLAAGALLGVVIAASGIVEQSPGASEVPDGAIAIVNGAPIQRVDYQRALAAVAAGRRTGTVDAMLRRHVLERLIDEQLLVQRGLELRLAERDQMARTYLSAAVINLVVARGEDDLTDASEAELRSFYRDNADYFRRAGRLQLEQLFFRAGSVGNDAAHERASAASRGLASGASFAELRASGDAPTVMLPSTPLRPSKLRDYLGPTPTAAALALTVGEISAPLRSSGGYHILRLVAREAASVLPFEQLRPQVLSEYRRREGERRVRQLLAERRADAEIAISEELL